MKKTFLLLFSIGTLSTVFAQDNRSHQNVNQTREIVLGNRRSDKYNSSYTIDSRKKQEEIDKVTRDFDRRIVSIQKDRHLRTAEKNRQIRKLRAEKEQAIRNIDARYENHH